MTTTLENIDLGYALAFVKITDNLKRALTDSEAAHRDECLKVIEVAAREEEREHRVEQAYNAAFHPDPEVRRYARLERRMTDVSGDELDGILAELDRLAESIYCRRNDC